MGNRGEPCCATASSNRTVRFLQSAAVSRLGSRRTIHPPVAQTSFGSNQWQPAPQCDRRSCGQEACPSDLMRPATLASGTATTPRIREVQEITSAPSFRSSSSLSLLSHLFPSLVPFLFCFATPDRWSSSFLLLRLLLFQLDPVHPSSLSAQSLVPQLPPSARPSRLDIKRTHNPASDSLQPYRK